MFWVNFETNEPIFMTFATYLLDVRLGSIGYILFDSVFCKGRKGGRNLLRIQINPILIKIKPSVLDTKKG